MILIQYLIRAKESFARKIMIVTCICAFIMNAGYLSELISPTKEACLASIKMEYFGATWVNFSLMIFVYSFCNKRINPYVLQILSVAEMLDTFAVFTNEMHNTLYSSIEYVTEPVFPHVKLTYGPLFYVHLALLMIVVFLNFKTIVGFYIHSKKTNANLRKLWMLKYIVVAPIVPFISMALYSLKILKVYDAAPILTLIVSSGIIIIMLRHNMFDLTDSARNAIIQNMDVAIIVLDEYYNLSEYNDVAGNLFPDLQELNPGNKINLSRSVPFEVFTDEQALQKDYEIDGRFFHCTVNPIRDEDEEVRGYIAAFRDVTAQRNNEADMAELQKRYDAAYKVKDDFLSNMSHEIRTPMNAIIGMSELIQTDSTGRRTHDYASDIKVASQSLLQIVDDIFDATRMESDVLELREVDYFTMPLLTEVCRTAKAQAEEKGLIFKHVIDDRMPCEFHGDINRVRQIFINLLSNAVKFTNKGYIELEVMFERLSDKQAKIIITVNDTGIGIKPVDVERIFMNFSQLDSEKNREAEGLGLGLSISKRLAKAMGGDITVTSEYGKGSTFMAEILQEVRDWTAISENKEEAEKTKAPARKFTAPDAKILIVDDNKINIKVVKGLLKPYMYQVDDVLSGFAALDALKEKDYDIIFMDHMMPEMDGVETTNRIRESGNRTTIIALTANTHEGAEAMFLANDFQDVMFKPIEKNRLREVLEEWTPQEKKLFGDEKTDAPPPPEEEEPGVVPIPYTKNINFDEGLAKSPLGIDDYISILDLYFEDGKTKRDYIRDLAKRKDYKNYTIEVHGLKSASYNIAANGLGDMAKEHEMAGREERFDFIEDNLGELLELYDKVLSEIKSILDAVKMKEAPRKPGLTISREEIGLMVKDVLSSVQNFKSKEAKEKLSSLMNFDIPEELRDKLTEIARLLKMYEDEKAEDALRELIDNI